MKYLAALLAIPAMLVFTGNVADATDRVICGEVTTCIDVSPPTRLDVLMYPGKLSGVPIHVRCADMGGAIGWEYWQGVPWYVCHGVDY